MITFSPLRHTDPTVVCTLDMHTGGEPVRVITSGFPGPQGSNVLERRRWVMNHADDYRKMLMWEPRGHADMYGCLITPPNDSGADFGVIFMHNEGYSTMCGHAIIALAKLAVLQGWVSEGPGEVQVVIDAPCGRIQAWVDTAQPHWPSRFYGVPSFILKADQSIEIDGQKIPFDLAYGGAFYAYINVEKIVLDLHEQQIHQLIHLGKAVKKAIVASGLPILHPFETDLSFLYGVIFMQANPRAGIDSRNVCVFADGEVDRSPTGSGVSGRMAIHHFKENWPQGKSMVIESITGSVFTGIVKEITSYGSYPAVIPEVSGTAFITGEHRFYSDPLDPQFPGFLLR